MDELEFARFTRANSTLAWRAMTQHSTTLVVPMNNSVSHVDSRIRRTRYPMNTSSVSIFSFQTILQLLFSLVKARDEKLRSWRSTDWLLEPTLHIKFVLGTLLLYYTGIATWITHAEYRDNLTQLLNRYAPITATSTPTRQHQQDPSSDDGTVLGFMTRSLSELRGRLGMQ